MNWDDYDVFCQVIEHRGFAAAARILERPKSSISAAISRLEASLDARLLERTTRQLQLTERGQALYESIGASFVNLRGARADALAQGNVVAGTLRVAGPHEFCTYQLGPVACSMMSRYPTLNISIEVEDDTINPVDRHYDVAFTRLDGALPAGSLVQRRVIAIEQGLFASPDLLKLQGEPNNLEELATMPLLCSTRDREWTFTAADGSVDHIPTYAPRLSSTNTHIRRQAAMAGLGVARFPLFFGEDAVRAGELRRVLINYACMTLRIYALLPGKRLVPAKARLFLDELEQRVNRLAGSVQS